MTRFFPSDRRFMQHALRLAARALGNVAPNPAVGCVIVSPQGHIVGLGWTGRGGRPHAEAQALSQAGQAAQGATAYVSLEPCAHHGKTPPCADALVAARVARVVIGAIDSDPRVSGRGVAKLRDAGIQVTEGVCKDEATDLNSGFFSRLAKGRPLVALKIAQSADGRVADAAGRSRWITSEPARRHGHVLRARYDAILVGIGTVLADDPTLTCRLSGLEDRSPLRIVLDTRLRLPEASRLAQTAASIPLIVFTASTASGRALESQGVEIVRMEANGTGGIDLDAMLLILGSRGITRVLVEGGPSVHAAFLSAGLADRVEIYSAPLLIGSAGMPAIGALPGRDLDSSPRLRPIGRSSLGPDALESFSIAG